MHNIYSFCKFKIPDNGGRVMWEVTNECNYACSYCIFSSTGRKPKGELTTEKAYQTIDELKELGFTYIKITGGEPFLREDMLDILWYAKNKGFDLDISTNASRITENIAMELEKLNLNYVHVSVDGYDQYSHEAVRGKKSFAPTIAGLNILKRYHIKIRIGTVIHYHNQSHIKAMIDFFNTFHVDKIAFSLMEPIGRLKDNKKNISIFSAKELAQKIDKLIDTYSYTNVSHNLSSLSTISLSPSLPINEKISCPGAEKFLFINSIGIVSPCPWISDLQSHYHHESLHEQSLLAILNSPLFEQFKWVKTQIAQQKTICPVNDLALFQQVEQLYKIECLEQQKFQSLYSFSTENLSYLTQNIHHKKNGKSLTITGSGDQAIMLSLLGYSEVTQLDQNILANYYAELKIELMKYLDFEQFKNFFLNTSDAFNVDIYQQYKEGLSFSCRQFWDICFSYYLSGEKLRQSKLFNLNYDLNEDKIFNSYYLRDERSYLLAQHHIKETKFFYLHQNLSSNTQLNDCFDLILLSNLHDYSHHLYQHNHIEQFKNTIVKPLYDYSLNMNGTIMFAYIFDYLNLLKSHQRNKINLLPERQKYYGEFNYQEYIIDSSVKAMKKDGICFIHKKHSHLE